MLDPDTTPFYQSKKNNFQPRLSATYSLTPQTVAEGRLRHLRRPGTDGRPDSADRSRTDQHDACRADRCSRTRSIRRPSALNFTTNPNNRSYQPRAYADDYTLPEKVYQYTASVQQELGGRTAASVAYVGSQGRNLFLRSIANRTIGVQIEPGATAAFQVREFDIVTCADGTTRDGTGTALTGTWRPDSIASVAEAVRRDRLQDERRRRQLQLDAAGADPPVGERGGAERPVHAWPPARARPAARTRRSPPATTRDAISDWEYDAATTTSTFATPSTRAPSTRFLAAGRLKGGWSVGGIANARSGLPVEVLIARNDIVYRATPPGSSSPTRRPAAPR